MQTTERTLSHRNILFNLYSKQKEERLVIFKKLDVSDAPANFENVLCGTCPTSIPVNYDGTLSSLLLQLSIFRYLTSMFLSIWRLFLSL